MLVPGPWIPGSRPAGRTRGRRSVEQGARPRLNGKNDRKLLRQVAGNVVAVLQGTLWPPAAPGGPFVLEGAGSQVNIKSPRPTEPAGEPPRS
jgi:hypothetical protein